MISGHGNPIFVATVTTKQIISIIQELFFLSTSEMITLCCYVHKNCKNKYKDCLVLVCSLCGADNESYWSSPPLLLMHSSAHLQSALHWNQHA